MTLWHLSPCPPRGLESQLRPGLPLHLPFSPSLVAGSMSSPALSPWTHHVGAVPSCRNRCWLGQLCHRCLVGQFQFDARVTYLFIHSAMPGCSPGLLSGPSGRCWGHAGPTAGPGCVLKVLSVCWERRMLKNHISLNMDSMDSEFWPLFYALWRRETCHQPHPDF